LSDAIDTTISNLSLNITWNCGEILPVLTFLMMGTWDECNFENPRKIPRQALGAHLGILCPSCRVASRTYTGDNQIHVYSEILLSVRG
jgi:hypothetical protein